MAIGIYLRVSTYGQNLESQRAEIEQYLKRHQLTDVFWFQDKESGATMKRSGFEQLQSAIFKGEIDTVIVYRLDRLSRSLSSGIALITEWCRQGIRLISVTQQLDLDGVIGQMVASLLFGIAEMELQNSKERQAAGIAVAKSKGIYTGRKKGTLKNKPARAKELRALGMKYKDIAKLLEVSRNTVINYLNAEEVE